MYNIKEFFRKNNRDILIAEITSLIFYCCLVVFAIILVIGFSNKVFAQDRMTPEQIKREYIFPNFHGLVIIPCFNDPLTPENQQHCQDYETELWWHFYALVRVDVIQNVVNENEEIKLRGLVRSDYAGGCVRVKFKTFKLSHPQANYELSEVIDGIWVTNHFPFSGACLEGSLGDYGSVGRAMEVEP